MPKILADKGPDRGRSWTVKSDGTFLIGRDSSSQISLRDDEISRRHCQIEFHDSSWWVRDLDSTNGLLINGETVQDLAKLKHNDHIDLGVTRLTFMIEEDPLVGKILGGCEVLSRIGRGGMGTVYAARQISLDRPVALKILSDKYTRDQSFIDMFIREARAAGLLSHPHIVQVYDVGREGDLHYFTMELMDHGSAENRIDENGTLPLHLALNIVKQAATGLRYAEKQGIVHRDIKPGNLMMTQTGTVKIGDLGIARKADSSGVVSQKEGVSGSPHYIAPEQARGEAIDQRADIYSLGATLYHCLTGKTPYKGKSARDVILKHMQAEEAPDPWSVVHKSKIPVDVRALIQRMMSPQPENRPQNAEELGQTLDHLISRYPAEKARHTFAYAITGIFLVSLFVSLYLSMSPPAEGPPLNSPFDLIKEQASILDPAIDRIGNSVTKNSDLDEIAQGLEDLDLDIRDLESRNIQEAGPVLVSLRKKYQQALENLRLEKIRRLELQQEADARELLTNLLIESESLKKPQDRLPALNDLISRFPETRAADRAKDLVIELENQIETQNLREQLAERDWNAIRPRAEGWLKSNQPGRAREEILAFPDKHQQTRAWLDRNAWLSKIDQQAINLWRETRVQIRERLQEGRKTEAKDLLQGLISRASLPSTQAFVAEVTSEIDSTDDSTEELSYAPLPPVLISCWETWNLGFQGLEATRQLRSALLENRFSGSDLKIADRHIEMLGQFDQILENVAEVTLPQRKGRLIQTPTAETPAPWITLKSDRVIYRDTADGTGRYLLWKELTPSCRLDLWLEASPEGEWGGFLALLLEFNQRGQEAEEIWKRVDSRLKELLQHLKKTTKIEAKNR